METVIVKNITVLEVFFDDLGIGVNAVSSRNFSALFPLYVIKSSTDLLSQLNAGNIVLNDGERDLKKIESQEFFIL